MIKAVLLDFDGTLVNRDILDIICGIAGKKQESEKLNRDFLSGKLTGLTALITRINFLQGLYVSQIQNQIEQNPYLTKGANEFLDFLKHQKTISILHSGNIIPVIIYYQKLLRIDYIVGTRPKMKGEKIVGISEVDFPGKDFKVLGVKKVLDKLNISPEETIAIGDSPADRGIFEFAGKSIAINPKNGIDRVSDFVIENDLAKAIPIIKDLNKLHTLK